MTEGIGQAIFIILIFGIFYLLKIVLSIVGTVIQSGRQIPSKTKKLNSLGIFLLLFSWLPFVSIVFSGETGEEGASNLLNILNIILLASNIIAGILFTLGLKSSADIISKKARSLWGLSIFLLLINIIIITTKTAIADATKFNGIGAVHFIETLFFVLFFICITQFPKKQLYE